MKDSPDIQGNVLRTGSSKEVIMKTRGKVLVIPVVLLVLLGAVSLAQAQVRLGIGIGGPPAYVVPAPPRVVVIPGTYVYYSPGLDVDILFYQGYWYRPYGGRWYRARSYNGPWGFIEPRWVPRPLIGLPHDYRYIHPGRPYIPYDQLRRHWGRWERDRYWDRHDRWDDRDRHDMWRDHGRGVNPRRPDHGGSGREGRDSDRGPGGPHGGFGGPGGR
jgi:hypothetical protein